MVRPVAENVAVAVVGAARALRPAHHHGASRRKAYRRWHDKLVDPLAQRSRPGDGDALGRQPAEGAARPLARARTRACSCSSSRRAASTSARARTSTASLRELAADGRRRPRRDVGLRGGRPGRRPRRRHGRGRVVAELDRRRDHDRAAARGGRRLTMADRRTRNARPAPPRPPTPATRRRRAAARLPRSPRPARWSSSWSRCSSSSRSRREFFLELRQLHQHPHGGGDHRDHRLPRDAAPDRRPVRPVGRLRPRRSPAWSWPTLARRRDSLLRSACHAPRRWPASASASSTASCVTVIGINALITTLGTLAIFRGLTKVHRRRPDAPRRGLRRRSARRGRSSTSRCRCSSSRRRRAVLPDHALHGVRPLDVRHRREPRRRAPGGHPHAAR